MPMREGGRLQCSQVGATVAGRWVGQQSLRMVDVSVSFKASVGMPQKPILCRIDNDGCSRAQLVLEAKASAMPCRAGCRE